MDPKVSGTRVRPEDITDDMVEEARDKLAARDAQLDKMFSDAGKARFKLELYLSHKKSMFKAVPGIMCFWESGTKFHGGGDVKAYLCPGAKVGRNACVHPLTEGNSSLGFFVCPGCQIRWKQEDVIGEVSATLYLPEWAEAVDRYYRILGHNADVYVKEPQFDIREVTQLEMEKDRGGEHMAKFHAKFRTYIYPLKNIIADTANGSTTLSRFKALLTA